MVPEDVGRGCGGELNDTGEVEGWTRVQEDLGGTLDEGPWFCVERETILWWLQKL